MKNGASDILKFLGNNWKVISGLFSAVIVVGGFIATTAIKIDRKQQREDGLQKEVKEISVSVKDLQESFDGYVFDAGLRLERIERGLQDQNNQISDMREENKATRRTLVESMAKNPGISKEDYNYLMNILTDIKKNNNGITGWSILSGGR